MAWLLRDIKEDLHLETLLPPPIPRAPQLSALAAAFEPSTVTNAGPRDIRTFFDDSEPNLIPNRYRTRASTTTVLNVLLRSTNAEAESYFESSTEPSTTTPASIRQYEDPGSFLDLSYPVHYNPFGTDTGNRLGGGWYSGELPRDPVVTTKIPFDDPNRSILDEILQTCTRILGCYNQTHWTDMFFCGRHSADVDTRIFLPTPTLLIYIPVVGHTPALESARSDLMIYIHINCGLPWVNIEMVDPEYTMHPESALPVANHENANTNDVTETENHHGNLNNNSVVLQVLQGGTAKSLQDNVKQLPLTIIEDHAQATEAPAETFIDSEPEATPPSVESSTTLVASTDDSTPATSSPSSWGSSPEPAPENEAAGAESPPVSPGDSPTRKKRRRGCRGGRKHKKKLRNTAGE
ncbi:hypothetical protein BDV12DRAFT_200543 [Aspergillus spectabilis]